MLTFDRCTCSIINNTISHGDNCNHSVKVPLVQDVVQKIFSYLCVKCLMRSSSANREFAQAIEIQLNQRKVSCLETFIGDLIDVGAWTKLRRLNNECQTTVEKVLQKKLKEQFCLNTWLKAVILCPNSLDLQQFSTYMSSNGSCSVEPLESYQWVDRLNEEEQKQLGAEICKTLPLVQQRFITFREKYISVRLFTLLKKLPLDEDKQHLSSFDSLKKLSDLILNENSKEACFCETSRNFALIVELVRANLDLAYSDCPKKLDFFKTHTATLPLFFEIASCNNLFYDKTSHRFDQLSYNLVLEQLVEREDNACNFIENEAQAVRQWLELLNQFHPWPNQVTQYFNRLYHAALESHQLSAAIEIAYWLFRCDTMSTRSLEFYCHVFTHLPLSILISDQGQRLFSEIPDIQKELALTRLLRPMLLEQFDERDLLIAAPFFDFNQPKLFSYFSELKFLYDQLSLKERLSIFEELVLLVDRLKNQFQQVYRSGLIEEHLYWILRLLNSEEQSTVLQRLDKTLRLALQNRIQRDTSIFPETYSEADILSYYQEQEAKRANASVNQEGPTTPRLSVSNTAYLDEDEFYSDIEEMADIDSNLSTESDEAREESDVEDFVANSDETSED